MRSTPESAPIKQERQLFWRRVIFLFFSARRYFFLHRQWQKFLISNSLTWCFKAIVCFDLQRNHQSHTCQNHNVDAETFESPRSERLGSLKIAIVQKSLGVKCHQRWRKHYLQCFTRFTLCTLFTILKLHTLFTLYNYVCSIMVLSKKRNGLLEWIPFRLLQLLEHLRC